MPGWFALASRLAGDDPQDHSSNEPQGSSEYRPPVIKRAGRPRGSVAFRAAVREQQDRLQAEAEAVAEPEATEPLESRAAAVPSRAAELCALNSAQSQVVVAAGLPLAVFRTVSDVSLMRCIEGCVLEQRRMLALQEQKQPEAPKQDNLLISLLKKSDRILTKTAVAESLQMAERTLSRKLWQCAAGLLNAQRVLWSRLTQKVSQCIESGSCEGLLIGRVRKYDESPFVLRLDSAGEVLGLGRRRSQQTEAQASRAKLVSTFHRIFMVFRRQAVDGKLQYQVVTGSLPHRVHVVETTSAANMKQTQDSCLADLPLPRDFSSLFKMRLMLSVTDRAASNLAVERCMQAEHRDWVFAQSHCTMHKAADAQSRQFDLVAAHVSGMLSASIAMQAGGTHAQLQEILRSIFHDRLVVVRGNPQLQEHRESLYELLLPLTGDDKLKRKKQRAILSALFNGNIQDETRIIHMSSDPSCTRDDMLPIFCRYGTWALLGGTAAPFFNRSKWLGGEVATAWHALLASHHGLHQLLFQRWSGSSESPKVPDETGLAGWAAVAARAAASTRVKCIMDVQRVLDVDLLIRSFLTPEGINLMLGLGMMPLSLRMTRLIRQLWIGGRGTEPTRKKPWCGRSAILEVCCWSCALPCSP